MAADEAGIAEAARLILAGQPVAVPTETVYGLAADATSGEAVARIYAAKGRPSFNPLIVHVPGVEEAERIALLDERARELAERYWPGPLTMVLKVRPDAPIASLVTAGLDTVAIRAAAHPAMRALLRAAGRPLAAPSANASGRISPTSAAHVLASLGGRIPLILDGGATSHGLESTIAAVREDGWSCCGLGRSRLRSSAPAPLRARPSKRRASSPAIMPRPSRSAWRPRRLDRASG
jgi:L-threonylcarbamoyladenylate synthase